MYKSSLLIILFLSSFYLQNINALEIHDNLINPPKIKKLKPKSTYAGDSITIKGKYFGPEKPTVFLGQNSTALEISSWSAELIHIIIPSNLRAEDYDLKVCQATICSNEKTLKIKSLNWRKILHFGLGGIAIFIIGLTLLKSGFRSIGSGKLKQIIQVFTKSDVRIISISAFLTFLLQSPTSFAYFVIGLIEIEAIQLSHAILFSLGSHFGGGVIGFLLHFNLVKNALFIVIIGMILRAIFKTKREFHPTINALLGFGMILYGAHLIKNGFSPLSEHPQTIEVVHFFQSFTYAQYYVLGILGALLTILLGSASIVMIIVITIAQTSQALDFYNSFAILCGMPVGTSIALYWHTRTKSLDSRQTAILQLLIHGGLWFLWGLYSNTIAHSIEAWIPNAVEQIENDSKILFPQMALHISIAYFVYLFFVLIFGWLISNRLWSYIREKNIGHSEKPLISIYGVEFCDETHFSENEDQELEKIKHVIGILNQKTMECFELIGNPQHTNHRYFYRLRRELKDSRARIQSLLLQYKGHSPDKSTNKELDIWMSFIFEYHKLYRIFIHLFKSEVEISQIPGDDFEKDLARKLRIRKYLIKSFHILSDIIEDPESHDLTHAQYYEIEVNRTERRAHRQALKAVGVGQIDTQAASFFLQSFSLQEQIGNILYRCCYELLATKRHKPKVTEEQGNIP